MRAVIQRVSEASVTVDQTVVGSIGRGFLVLVGVADPDEEKDAFWIAEKVAGLRVFEDSDEKMNLSLADVWRLQKRTPTKFCGGRAARKGPSAL